MKKNIRYSFLRFDYFNCFTDIFFILSTRYFHIFPSEKIFHSSLFRQKEEEENTKQTGKKLKANRKETEEKGRWKRKQIEVKTEEKNETEANYRWKK